MCYRHQGLPNKAAMITTINNIIIIFFFKAPFLPHKEMWYYGTYPSFANRSSSARIPIIPWTSTFAIRRWISLVVLSNCWNKTLTGWRQPHTWSTTVPQPQISLSPIYPWRQLSDRSLTRAMVVNQSLQYNQSVKGYGLEVTTAKETSFISTLRQFYKNSRKNTF